MFLLFKNTYTSQSNYIHCDLTSNNILLDEDLRAKVSDLGLTRKINDMSNKQTGHSWWCAPVLVIINITILNTLFRSYYKRTSCFHPR
jgi:serine/threonine protein kinase